MDKAVSNPRLLAAKALLDVERKGAWSNLAADGALRGTGLQGQDGAFFSALLYGVLERRVTLDACIAAHARGGIARLHPAVLTALRMGMYELLYMDGVPDHAAVHESVETVKSLGIGRAAGLVNGVLRAFLRGGKTVPAPEGGIAAGLSVRYSCPEELVALWLRSYGEAATERVLADSLGQPPTYLRVNTLRISAAELRERLVARGLEVSVEPELPDCLRVQGGGAHLVEEFAEGLFHVQDKASQLCALAVEAAPEMRVLDACSAPGGKAFTLLELMAGQGELVACDLHEHRVGLIRKRGEAMGLPNLTAKALDMGEHHPELGLFDRVLCDAPCSGLGVIRRKPEIKYKALSDFENLPNIQYKILECSAQYCKAGGRLVYATCTLNPAENQDVRARFLSEHGEFAPAALPEVLGGSERTLLGELGADGFYLAAFTRG